MNSFQPTSTSSSDEDWLQQVNLDQMFTLMDRLLPFEACLYYQVLPLSLEGSRLNLGMVDPEDAAATDYVRRMLSYIHCSIVSRPIPSAAHREMLSRYLNRSSNSAQPPAAEATSASELPETTLPDLPEATSLPESPSPQPSRSQPRVSDRNLQSTFIVDSPEELDWTEIKALPSQGEEPKKTAEGAAPPNTSSMPASSAPRIERSPASLSVPAQKQTARSAPQPSPKLPGGSTPAALDITVNHLSSPLESLIDLTPKALLHELLGRVLVSGIGRLYFENQRDHGRVLWSQNGVMQSVLDDLPKQSFQGVMYELKRLMDLPLMPVKEVKQVESERIYRGSRLLLRLRVMPGKHGEEATLQVLRGAALKFYQQQLIGNLGREALSLAQRLQQRVNEIRDRSAADMRLSDTQLEALPALRQLLRQLDQQVEELIQNHLEPPSS